MIHHGLEVAATTEPAFQVCMDHSLPLISRAVAQGESDSLRKLLGAARAAKPPDSIPDNLRVLFWSRMGRWEALLGDQTAAKTSFDLARDAADEIAKANTSPFDEEPIRNFVILASDLRLSGFTAESEEAVQLAIELFNTRKPSALLGSTRGWTISALRSHDLETTKSIVERLEVPSMRIFVRCDLAKAAFEQHDLSADDRVSDALRDVQHTKRREWGKDAIDRLYLDLEVAEVQAFAGREQVARKLFARASRFASSRRKSSGTLHDLIVESAIRANMFARGLDGAVSDPKEHYGLREKSRRTRRRSREARHRAGGFQIEKLPRPDDSTAGA